METQRFVNPGQPQTLYMGTVLAYIQGGFDLLYGVLGLNILLVALGAAKGFGAFGIANDKKWGYNLALAGAAASVLLDLLLFRFNLGSLLRLMFDGALVGLLVHPMSRDHQRVWFN